MTNRMTRRAFQQAAKGFKPPSAGGWGEWRDRDIHSREQYGVIPSKNLYRFTANNQYSVQFYRRSTVEFGEIVHLMVRPHNCKPVHNWQDLQRIKNELMGPERLAIEVFPPESELVDDANMYHLWVFPEGFQFPFGLR